MIENGKVIQGTYWSTGWSPVSVIGPTFKSNSRFTSINSTTMWFQCVPGWLQEAEGSHNGSDLYCSKSNQSGAPTIAAKQLQPCHDEHVSSWLGASQCKWVQNCFFARRFANRNIPGKISIFRVPWLSVRCPGLPAKVYLQCTFYEQIIRSSMYTKSLNRVPSICQEMGILQCKLSNDYELLI